MTDDANDTPRISWAMASARRLERHALAAPSPDARPADIVAAMCGAHAQILSAAELSVGLRLAGGTRHAVRAALWEDHSLIKTFGPRGTVHLLPARDLALWTGALGAIPRSPSPFPEGVRLTPEETDAVVAAIADALADAALTVDELTEAVVARAGAWAGERTMPAFNGVWPRWRQAVATAAHRGVLCFGPDRGRNVTYTSPRRWLPEFRPADGDTAIATLLTRYLHAYGPATPRHIAQWLAAPQRWAAGLFAALGASGAIEAVAMEGERMWVVAGDTDAPPARAAGVRLLPYFDPYVVGSHPRALLYPGAAAARALAPSGQAGNYPVLLIGGVVAGVWHLRRSGRRLAITVEPLRTLTATERRELDTQAARIGAILEGTPDVTIGTIAVGPHA